MCSSDLGNEHWRNQPRVRAGNEDGGQWTTGGESGTSEPRVEPIGLKDHPADMTVRDFISKYCEGRVTRIIGDNYLTMTLGEIIDAAKNRDQGARTCKKLLERGEYRK